MPLSNELLNIERQFFEVSIDELVSMQPSRLHIDKICENIVCIRTCNNIDFMYQPDQ